jgi:hypothetical protein
VNDQETEKSALCSKVGVKRKKKNRVRVFAAVALQHLHLVSEVTIHFINCAGLAIDMFTGLRKGKYCSTSTRKKGKNGMHNGNTDINDVDLLGENVNTIKYRTVLEYSKDFCIETTKTQLYCLFTGMHDK